MHTTTPMFDRDLYQMEVSGRFATMYIVDTVSRHTRSALLRACQMLPASVEALCVDVDGTHQLDEGAPMVIQELRRYWYATRTGMFRLVFGPGRARQSHERAVLVAG